MKAKIRVPERMFYPGTRPPPRYRTLDPEAIVFRHDLVYNSATEGWEPVANKDEGLRAFDFPIVVRHEYNFTFGAEPFGWHWVKKSSKEITNHDIVWLASPNKKYFVRVEDSELKRVVRQQQDHDFKLSVLERIRETYLAEQPSEVEDEEPAKRPTPDNYGGW